MKIIDVWFKTIVVYVCIAPAILQADNRPNIVFMLSDDQGWNGTSVVSVR